MPFNLRHTLRQIPATTLRPHLVAKGVAVPPDIWNKPLFRVAEAIFDLLASSTEPQIDAVIGDLSRVHFMASERGRLALVSASPDPEALGARFSELDNDTHRALWVLGHHPEIFDRAEALFFFDHRSEGRQARHYRTQPSAEVARDESSLRDFQDRMCTFFRRMDGSGVSCWVEFVDRPVGEGVQLAIYVQGLPSHRVEFVDREFKRSVTHPAIEAALVYEPKSGRTTTVIGGGKKAHETLREAFALALLKIEPRFDKVEKVPFSLNSLRSPRRFPIDPESGLKSVRVRKLGLVTPIQSDGLWSIEAPPATGASVYDLGDSWFAERAPLFRKFDVIYATLSFQFQPTAEGGSGRTVHVELARPNRSNLKNLRDAERRVAEAHLQLWDLVGMPG